jgi:beta-lactamase regulating signal transducer with metallopeptidase domain
MQHTELFLSLAEIAGVFVGFGALISVRSGGASGRIEVGYTRGMVAFGVLTVVAALAPVTLSLFDLPEHQIWALSSALVLVGLIVFVAAQARTAEYRANVAAGIEATRAQSRSRWPAVLSTGASVLSMIALVLAPIVIVLGVAPALETALYFAVVVLILLCAAWLLLALVYSQRLPENA